MLKLKIKWTRFKSNYSSYSIKKWKDKMKLSLPPKFVGKLVWVAVISFRKIFIPSYRIDAVLR